MDLAANARSLGAHVIDLSTATTISPPRCERRRAIDRTTVIYIQNDRYEGVPGYESWWDVPVAEVSERRVGAAGAGGLAGDAREGAVVVVAALHIGNAPCSWGAIEFEDNSARVLGYAQMLDELVATGYTGTELGDWGFMPTDPARLRVESNPARRGDDRRVRARPPARTGGARAG